MFGEGKHLGIDKIYEAKLAPFMTQTSLRFWNSRLWYFKQGLYYQGGMVRLPPPMLRSTLRSRQTVKLLPRWQASWHFGFLHIQAWPVADAGLGPCRGRLYTMFRFLQSCLV